MQRSLPTHAQFCFVAASTLIGVACASETGTEGPAEAQVARVSAEVSILTAPQHGFQVESPGVWIDPGDDVRMCEVIVLPGSDADVYHINRIQSLLTSRAEDLIVRAAEPGSDTAAAMDRGASLSCTRAGEAFGEELKDVLRSRTRYADETFPTGTGHVLRGGQKLAVEYHVVNDAKDLILAKAQLAFHLVSADQVQHKVHTASFENFTIYTPPHGNSSHVGECRVRQELFVSDLVRRTQLYGTTFKVWHAGGEHDGELLWQSDNSTQNRLDMAQPLHLQPGDGFRFQCDYQNPSARELRYGVSADDETCTLEALFWLTDESQEPLAEDCLLFNVDSDGVARSPRAQERW
ncbi:MAG TPA: hypothetical protein VFN67_14065 [Polyangiales bacterium]|nr:hypothetical protein [Polyangiales bacterium]